ncbi:MAG: hypothetical protein LBT49_04475 [Prevotellaceae bacterium]|jgi:hypothetical protein|nr:hypothetical protein [Prevotellaceae bacterium]
MKNTLKTHLVNALVCATVLFAVAACKEKEEKMFPANAGSISGTAENVCPAKTVDLSIGAIAEATAYVWYRNDEAIPDASGASYTVTQSGSYTVGGKNVNGEGAKSAVYIVNIVPCPGDEGAVPAAAGTITGSAVNNCPSQAVVLSVAPITGATSYSWSISYAADDIDTAVTVEPAYTGNFAKFKEGRSLTYTVSGLNALGYGVASPPHVATKVLCIAAKPVIQGKNEWKTGQRGDTAVYTIQCPATSMPGTATTSSGNVIRYKWFWQLVGSDPALTSWTTDGHPVQQLGSPQEYTYNFAVIAVTADGESPMSDVVQIVGTQCYVPNPPGGAKGNIALYPTAPGFYPTKGQYSFGVSNCEIQEVTKIVAGVELACNDSKNTSSKYPVTGYSFWVKTTESGTFTKVFTSGTSSTARKIVVDGTTYPSGTYMVTAQNNQGDSDFGNNWIAVKILNDCPVPVINLEASTISTSGYSGQITGGVLTNKCPEEKTNMYLDVPTIPAVPSTITWTRIKPDGGTEEAWADLEYKTEINNISTANNGTYSVKYTKFANGKLYESPTAEIIIDLKICPPDPPTFAIKPRIIASTVGYAEVILNNPENDAITGYEWYFNDSPATNTQVETGSSSFTYKLKEAGTYKVRAKSTRKGESAFSEEITLTKVTPPSSYDRSAILGTYDVVDYRGAVSDQPFLHTLTIEAHAHVDSIIIKKLGNVNTPIKAAVSFVGSVGKDGIYGTITIPKQVSGNYKFRHLTTENNSLSCDDANVIVDIKFSTLNGKPSIAQSGLRYYLGKQDCTGSVNSAFGGGINKTVTWTKK